MARKKESEAPQMQTLNVCGQFVSVAKSEPVIERINNGKGKNKGKGKGKFPQRETLIAK